MPDSQVFYTIQFPNTGHKPIQLPAQSQLAQHLTVQNSPVLFGCRTGICGTCLVQVEGDLPDPSPEEQEVLDALIDPECAELRPGELSPGELSPGELSPGELSPGDRQGYKPQKFRLACQLSVTGPLAIVRPGSAIS
jgi:ferredoxin